MLYFTEKILDQMPRFIKFFVISSRLFSVLLSGNDNFFHIRKERFDHPCISIEALSANIVFSASPGKSLSEPSRSQACPGIRVKSTGLPKASTTVWIFVLTPLCYVRWLGLPGLFWRLSYAGERERYCCRSWQIHCRCQLLGTPLFAQRMKRVCTTLQLPK